MSRRKRRKRRAGGNEITSEHRHVSLTRQPSLLNIELTNRCNARCVYCIAGREGLELCDLDFDTYRRIIDGFPSAKSVWPFGNGEPLLYPRVVDTIAYAHDAGKDTVLYTNASLLTLKMSKALLDAGLTRMVFSVDAGDAHTYAKLRPGLDWDTMVQNITEFWELAHDYDVHTTARFTRAPENADVRRSIVDFWKDKVHNVWGRSEVYIPKSGFEGGLSSVQASVTCDAPFDHLVVRSNGDVVLCCRDYWGHYAVGNVHEQDVTTIYNCEEFKAIRAAMLAGVDYPKLCDVCEREHQRHG